MIRVVVWERELPKSHSLGSAQNDLPDLMGGRRGGMPWVRLRGS